MTYSIDLNECVLVNNPLAKEENYGYMMTICDSKMTIGGQSMTLKQCDFDIVDPEKKILVHSYEIMFQLHQQQSGT